jgi:mono/diheme cytochrome c family protein
MDVRVVGKVFGRQGGRKLKRKLPIKESTGGSMPDSRKSITGATFDTSSTPAVSAKRIVRVGGFAILAGAAFALVIFSSAPSARAADDDGAQTYKSNCVVCHGADGTGTATGKSLMAPDLHSDVVQKMSVAQMIAQVSDGKNNMPPFKSTLSDDQIKAVVDYVRTTFGKKK